MLDSFLFHSQTYLKFSSSYSTYSKPKHTCFLTVLFFCINLPIRTRKNSHPTAMYLQPETNPHFLPPEHQHNIQPRFPLQPSRHHSPEIPLQPAYTRPNIKLPKTRQNSNGRQPSQPRRPPRSPEILLQPPYPRPNQQPPRTHQNTDHHPPPPFQPLPHQSQQGQTHHTRPANQSSSSQRVKKSRKTKSITWMIAALCTLFWVLVIFGGLIILVYYFLYRPHLPKFDVSGASLNAAYLDLGYLLNADINLLANFTNTNKKVNVEFSNMIIDLHAQGALIATRYIEPFSVMRGDYMLMNVHMVSSQVPLLPRQRELLRRQIDGGRVELLIKGVVKIKSHLGFLRYSYWLYAQCRIIMSGPPSGIMLRKICVTKR